MQQARRARQHQSDGDCEAWPFAVVAASGLAFVGTSKLGTIDSANRIVISKVILWILDIVASLLIPVRSAISLAQAC